MIWVDGKGPGSRTPLFSPFGFEPDLDSPDGDVYRVRHLIAKLVTESVRDFRMRENDGALLALTPEKIAAGLVQGRIGKARDEVQSVDVDTAIGQALQAFEDGLYLVFVDDEEKRSLEEMVSLNPDTKVTLIRLTALAGR